MKFLDDLAILESGGNYKAFNKYGYAGKYQMGEMAMIDAGYYIKRGNFNNDWSGKFTGKDKVYSIKDFLNNPQAQENAQLIFKKKHSSGLIIFIKLGSIGRYPSKHSSAQLGCPALILP